MAPVATDVRGTTVCASCGLVVSWSISARALLLRNQGRSLRVSLDESCCWTRLGGVPQVWRILCAEALGPELLLDCSPRSSSRGQMESSKASKVSEER